MTQFYTNNMKIKNFEFKARVDDLDIYENKISFTKIKTYDNTKIELIDIIDNYDNYNVVIIIMVLII